MKWTFSLSHTHLSMRKQLHENAHEEVVVAVVGAEVWLQQREVLWSLPPLLSLLTEVGEHIHVVFDPLVDALQV